MHRRRIFVYPRHDPPQGHWINGGLHPLFAVPTPGPSGEEGWLRIPAFLHTGFALVMPPFVTYAQGWEVMQPERLPRQARAWKVFSERLGALDLAELPPAPEALKLLATDIEQELMSYLEEKPEGGGESIKAKLDSSLDALKRIEKQMDRLANGKDLTPQEKKTRRAIALISRKLDKGRTN